MRTFRTTTKLLALGLVAVLAGAAGAAIPAGAAKKQSTEPVTLRLGYFPNVTHASAIVGVEGGIFAKKLGTNVDLEAEHVQLAAPRRSQAFQAGALDASYIGPNPTITAWTQLDKGVKVDLRRGVRRRVLRGQARRSTAPPTSRARPSPSPQLGNTQDVALRTWLKTTGPQHRHERRR